ncbi:cytochrome c1 heme lyase [Lepidopterella palustris CBS 459.81]|uniref:Holocytochrome c-type synthase n=1 Tax=Lepidopterella palustris CBS 459.81 TaxID=1314670 RepID=A0A8E2JGG8_9PEZI|nr:cytochrome c1 heme lyase [Lepidopterella palustris CBS 459.81]
MANQAESSPSVCPVDHKTREAWLSQAKGQKPPVVAAAAKSPLQAESCDSSQVDQSAAPKSASPLSSVMWTRLGSDREVSSIPRALPKETSPKSTLPANNEQETGADKSGNWIYPSEQMFFNAMKRKQYNPDEKDMKAIVPIHNAVNERAWKEIKEWERGRGGDSCGGPRLESFSGLSSALTPRARVNTWLGYQPPFDRHDWVIDRCGTKIEYVIDFYAGRDEKKTGKELNFYLDVRPKLNSWEGWKMRALRLVGL